MQISRKTALFALTAAFGLGALGTAALADQPNMQDALRNLEQAKNNLQAATPDKGGHRNKALKLVNQAIAQVNAGIGFDRRH